jgi:anti-anti-sigma regulatory factor
MRNRKINSVFTIKKDNKNKKYNILLSGELTIINTLEITNLTNTHFDKTLNIVINAKNISTIDLLGAQALLFLLKEFQNAHSQIKYIGPDEPKVCSLLDNCGLSLLSFSF